MKLRMFGALAALAITLPGCGAKITAREESPFGPIEISESSAEKEVTLKLRTDISDDDVVDPGLFGDFWPSITHAEATEKSGEPLFVRNTGPGIFYYYRTAGGVVEVAREQTRSWGVATVWKLRAYPKNSDPDGFLAPAIAKYIKESGDYTTLTILNPNGTPGKVFLTKNGEVLYAIWVNERDSPESEARKQPTISRGEDH